MPEIPSKARFEDFSESEKLSVSEPPPEVTALLSTQASGWLVSPVFARDSPLVPWELPSEIGHFWLGLFKISAVKVIFISGIRFRFIQNLLSSAR